MTLLKAAIILNIILDRERSFGRWKNCREIFVIGSRMGTAPRVPYTVGSIPSLGLCWPWPTYLIRRPSLQKSCERANSRDKREGAHFCCRTNNDRTIGTAPTFLCVDFRQKSLWEATIAWFPDPTAFIFADLTTRLSPILDTASTQCKASWAFCAWLSFTGFIFTQFGKHRNTPFHDLKWRKTYNSFLFCGKTDMQFLASIVELCSVATIAHHVFGVLLRTVWWEAVWLKKTSNWVINFVFIVTSTDRSFKLSYSLWGTNWLMKQQQMLWCCENSPAGRRSLLLLRNF